jgi:ATP-dependent RNA helicase SUPV3L1/SUV3
MYGAGAKSAGFASKGRITAVLGPTNTGKTHFAVERMLAHRSGMIGLPLRLLAREVYDRVVRQKGLSAAALITGEEKIVPPHARYFICTVEAMPLDIGVACLVVDEIQLCADAERGHVFTNRLLHARGEEATMFLGADTMRGAIQRFVPEAYFLSRSRFSDLTYSGTKKLTRLPRRSAIVGFSVDEVYGIAELVRRQRGGAAVVLGALSPRTRNAQVALYQSGDVDFLVATDAIGMGLNMDVDHVAFSGLEKFDGVGVRPLRPDELGQIAGRAGRHMNDGTFGVTAEAAALDEESISRIETHRYEPVRVLQWRNSDLAFRSLDALIQSLEAPPPARGLVKSRPATDVMTLRLLSSRDQYKRSASAPAAVRLLWDVCQLPDFRKLNLDEHIRLVEAIYAHLAGPAQALSDDWLSRQVARLDQVEGDVATLSARLSHIRTWTYVAHRSSWVRNSAHWQGATRAIEERISDALHERLTQRFVDRRTSILMRSMREGDEADVSVDDSGGVAIAGEIVGKLDGFCFVADFSKGEAMHLRAWRTAALRGLEGEFFARARRLCAAQDDAFTLSEHGKLWWDGAIVGLLTRGSSPLVPAVSLVTGNHLRREEQEAVLHRLRAWTDARIRKRIGPLLALREAADAPSGRTDAIPPYARGIAHRLCETFGAIDLGRETVPGDLRLLIRSLSKYGVWFGRRTVYLPKLLRPEPASMLVLLWGLWNEREQLQTAPPPGVTSLDLDQRYQPGFLAAAGFKSVGQRAVRFDILERLEQELEKAACEGARAEDVKPRLVALLGASSQATDKVIERLGWREFQVNAPESGTIKVLRRARDGSRKLRLRSRQVHSEPELVSNSPFAGLSKLLSAR